jgi:hypothetical protein
MRLLISWLAIFTFVGVWWLANLPYPVPVSVFGVAAGLVALYPFAR